MPFEPDHFEPEQSAPNTNAPPLPTSTLPPLTSQWEATKFGLGQAAGGAWDALKGMAKAPFSPQGDTETNVSNIAGPGGLALYRMMRSGLETAKQIPQVPGAIRDIANSPSPLAALATSMPYSFRGSVGQDCNHSSRRIRCTHKIKRNSHPWNEGNQRLSGRNSWWRR